MTEPNEKLGDLTYEVRSSSQARGATTQTALLDAAEVLFAEHGVDATTVAGIAALAGSSVGSFYHHFGDKETIQFALFDRFLNDSEAAMLRALAPDRWEGAGIGSIVHSYVRLALRSYEVRPSFKQAGLAIAAAHPELRASYDRVRVATDKSLKDLMMARQDQIGHPNPDLACTFVVDQVQNMLLARSDDPSSSDQDFLREAIRSICQYLETDLPAD